jgi:taurine dioxygenase
MTSLEIFPLSDALGAEIRGVDLSAPLDEATAREIEDIWNQHIVIVFRDQDFDIEQQRAFARFFGDIGTRARPGPKPPEADQYGSDVMLVTNVRKDSKPIGSLPDGEMMFHSDTPYFENPAKATMLFGLEVTAVGGHTLFSNCYRAAETLPEDMKRRLEGKFAMQVYEYGTTLKTQNYDRTKFPHYAHPVFRKHPATGRSALFVNELMTEEIIGLPKDESDEILAFLFAHLRRPEFIYEHVWRVGDLVMWDNRCSLHARTDFPGDQRRMLRRLTVHDVNPVLAGAPPYAQAAAE